MKFYSRINRHVLFLLPTVAIGQDYDGRIFFEVGFLFFAIGVGDA